jgi:hypothetical protein
MNLITYIQGAYTYKLAYKESEITLNLMLITIILKTQVQSPEFQSQSLQKHSSQFF